jgi:hypothetical protein
MKHSPIPSALHFIFNVISFLRIQTRSFGMWTCLVWYRSTKLHGIKSQKIRNFSFKTLFHVCKNHVKQNGTGTPHAIPIKYTPLETFLFYSFLFYIHLLYISCRIWNKYICSISTGSGMCSFQWHN